MFNVQDYLKRIRYKTVNSELWNYHYAILIYHMQHWSNHSIPKKYTRLTFSPNKMISISKMHIYYYINDRYIVTS